MGAIISFVGAVMDWLKLPVSMPFPHDFQKIFFPKWHAPWETSRERKIYADTPYTEADGEGVDRQFHPASHRKYNGRFCFQNEKEEISQIDRCIERINKKLSDPKTKAKPDLETKLHALQKVFEQRKNEVHAACLEDPTIKEPFHKNNGTAEKGYRDFLRSLEVIGMQEYIKREHTGQGLSPEAQKELLRKLKEEGDFIKWECPDGSSKPVPKDIENEEDLQELARWERMVQLRDYSEIRNRWFKNLAHRTQCPTKMRSDIDIDQCKHHPAPGGNRYPGIRRKTFWLLTRPIEPDWNVLTVVGYLVAITTYLFSVYTQVASLASTCAGPYMCPLAHLVDRNPLIAPPLPFRQPAADPYYYTDRWRYYPRAIEACAHGTAGCDRPGYHVQWPYMQTNASDLSAVGFPADLARRCTRVEGGAEGVTWNPFARALVTHYYDCAAACPGGEAAGCALSFEEAAPGGGAAWMHLDVEWFDRNHATTVACIEELVADGVVSGHAEAAALVGQASVRAQTLTRRLDQCISSDRGLTELAQHCNCREGQSEWPMALYHDTSPVSTCASDIDLVAGTICVTSDDCDAQAACERKWTSSRPLAATRTFGCYFRSPDAQEPVPTDYFTCGFSVEQQIIRSTTVQPLLSRQQIAVEVDVTKKTALITAFMIKEGGIVSAWILTTAIILFLLSFLIVPAAIIVAVAILWMSFMGDRLENVKNVNTVLIYAHEGYVFLLHVIYSLLLNMSTSYRIYKLLASIASKQTNASLEDLNRKVTNLVNILLNLAILVFSDTEIYQNSLLIASIALSFILVLFQMQLEKESLEACASALKDMNENRLSKFEMALVLHKIMEDFLSDDVQFTWTKHFVSQDESLLVDELREFEEEKSTERKLGQGQTLEQLYLRQDRQDFTQKIAEYRPSYFYTSHWQEAAAREMDIDQSFPLLPKPLATKFGHDSRYEFFPLDEEDPLHPRRPERSLARPDDAAEPAWGRPARPEMLQAVRKVSQTDKATAVRSIARTVRQRRLRGATPAPAPAPALPPASSPMHRQGQGLQAAGSQGPGSMNVPVNLNGPGAPPAAGGFQPAGSGFQVNGGPGLSPQGASGPRVPAVMGRGGSGLMAPGQGPYGMPPGNFQHANVTYPMAQAPFFGSGRV